MSSKTNLLFICSGNQLRSPTAEKIWSNKIDFNARSAGTSPNAKKSVSADDLRWAHIIFTMEEKHKNRIVAEYARIVEHKKIHVLDIPDDFKYMQPELIVELENKVSTCLSNKT